MTPHSNLHITSPEELEGNDKRSGVFLNILRNQCTERRRGSVVVLDEASFLNSENFISPSKRVFNGTFTQLKTTYFGTGIDGSGVTLKVPPILLLATNNEEITDPALKSRFDVINFPNPKPESLLSYSRELISLDSLSKKIPGLLNSTTQIGVPNYAEELELAIRELQSFRDVQAKIPVLLNNWYERTRRV